MTNQTITPATSRSFAHTIKGIINGLGDDFFASHVADKFESPLKAGFALASKHFEEGMEISENDLNALVQAEFGQISNNLENPIMEAAADNAAEMGVKHTKANAADLTNVASDDEKPMTKKQLREIARQEREQKAADRLRSCNAAYSAIVADLKANKQDLQVNAIARALLIDGFEVSDIAKVTGKTYQRIKNVQKLMRKAAQKAAEQK